MPTTPPKLTPGEFEILKILWRIESGTVAQVREEQQLRSGLAPAYTTTMTMLGRLVDKHAVRVDRERQPFRYRPTLRRATLLKRRLREFVRTVYEDDPELVVRQILSEGYLSEQDLVSVAREYAKTRGKGRGQ